MLLSLETELETTTAGEEEQSDQDVGAEEQHEPTTVIGAKTPEDKPEDDVSSNIVIKIMDRVSTLKEALEGKLERSLDHYDFYVNDIRIQDLNKPCTCEHQLWGVDIERAVRFFFCFFLFLLQIVEKNYQECVLYKLCKNMNVCSLLRYCLRWLRKT